MLFRLTSLTRSQLSSLLSTAPPTLDDPDIVAQYADPPRPKDATQAATSSARDTFPATTDAALCHDDPLGPEPFPRERVLHSLVHFLTHSHISSTS